MKTKLFAAVLFTFILNHLQAAPTINFVDSRVSASAYKGGDPIDIKVVVSQKRIWLVADEMPMRCLKTQVKNAEGKIVLEKCFTSKMSDWFLNIEALPKGEYTLYLGSERTEKFKK